MFLLVMLLSGYFISNVWNKWETSPLIVTMGAHGTSIKDIPFPGWFFLNLILFIIKIPTNFRCKYEAVTICNMNQAQKSAVSSIPRDSEEYAALRSICQNSVDEKVNSSAAGTWNIFRKVLLKVNVC